jgi:predicted phosphodiesterase
MRIALLSDIHGNLLALEAVLADVQRHGPFDEIVVAGDLVWAGPWPAEVVDRVRELNAAVIQGNTDAFFCHRPDETPAGKQEERFAAHLTWMLERLGPERTTYLQTLPFSHRISPSPTGDELAPQQDLSKSVTLDWPSPYRGSSTGQALLVVHANPLDLEQAITLNMMDADLDELLLPPAQGGAGGEPDWVALAFGHVHVPFSRKWRGRLLVDVASVGLPMDGDPRAVYAILTWNGTAWQAQHHRVFYDAPVVAHQMRTCGMPRGKHFAERLMAAGYKVTALAE